MLALLYAYNKCVYVDLDAKCELEKRIEQFFIASNEKVTKLLQ